MLNKIKCVMFHGDVLMYSFSACITGRCLLNVHISVEKKNRNSNFNMQTSEMVKHFLYCSLKRLQCKSPNMNVKILKN
jgi:hypothetical protein